MHRAGGWRRWPGGVAVLLGWALIATRAQAFSSPEAYAEAAATGGGGGRFFSGSPADGFGCSVCHTGGPKQPAFPLYVTGLANDGFMPGESREIVLSWPEFAAQYSALRPDPMQPAVPGLAIPAASVVAELVPESGQGAGVIEIHTERAGADELCEKTRPNLKPRVAAKLYQVRRGVAPRALVPDKQGVVRCEALQLGQRCVIALTSCGAKQLRFVWTAPPQWQGPIWFSAGFVASLGISGTPEDDSVVEVTVPMQRAGSSSADYEERLRSSCASSRARASARPSTLIALLLLACAALIGVRRGRRKRGPSRLAWLALVCAASGCGDARDERPNALAGLYAPGSALGASDPNDVLRPGMGLGERCVTPSVSMPIVAGAAGSGAAAQDSELSVDYTTQSQKGRYAPRNCSAVWVETPDGQFVATLEIAAALRRPGLVYFQDHTCVQQPGPDVVTSATRRDHVKPHSVTWSGVDFQGAPVSDGPYVLNIEVAESDKEPGELTTFPFDKGAPFSRDEAVAVDGALMSMKLSWGARSAP